MVSRENTGIVRTSAQSEIEDFLVEQEVLYRRKTRFHPESPERHNMLVVVREYRNDKTRRLGEDIEIYSPTVFLKQAKVLQLKMENDVVQIN